MTPYLALRVDVETAPGLVLGLPGLLSLLESRGIRATLMLPTGPDRSGLALTRVLQSPRRIGEMLRLRPGGRAVLAAFLAGVAVPVRPMAPVLRAARPVLSLHEVALHGHDHWLWIHRCRKWPLQRVQVEFRRGTASFARALGCAPVAFGAPGWVATERTLRAVDVGGFRYASDCRGTCPFIPAGRQTPQLPTTLPTVEEFVRERRNISDLCEHIARHVEEQPYSCYCAHAEVEGMRFPRFLPQLLDRIQGRVAIGPLGDALASGASLPTHRVEPVHIAGRFDPVASQVPS